MESSGEELLKKIRKLEVGQALLKQEMSKFALPPTGSGAERRRSQSVSPSRGAQPHPAPAPSRRPSSGGFDGGPRAWGRGSASFSHSSPLQREGRAAAEGGATGAGLAERQYRRVLQSLGQSVHIPDLDGRIIYWYRHDLVSGFFVPDVRLAHQMSSLPPCLSCSIMHLQKIHAMYVRPSSTTVSSGAPSFSLQCLIVDFVPICRLAVGAH